MTIIETHAHLDYPDFAPDFADVLRRAEEADVTRIVTIGTSLESSMRAVELAEKYPSVFAVIGVHPTYAEEAADDVIDPLRELAKSRRVVAIGETGLDYHRLPSVELSKERKTQVFAKALQSFDRRRNRSRHSRRRLQIETGEFVRATARSRG